MIDRIATGLLIEFSVSPFKYTGCKYTQVCLALHPPVCVTVYVSITHINTHTHGYTHLHTLTHPLTHTFTNFSSFMLSSF